MGRFVSHHQVHCSLRERRAAKQAARGERDAKLASWRGAHAEAAEAWTAARERRVPADLPERLCAGVGEKEDATRNHGKRALQTLVECVPYLLGGSADLAGSAAPPNLQGVGTLGDADAADPFAGVNVHFGVREHAMAAISNGAALDGTLRPYCGTFLIFSDYMRPSIRLASLMGLPVTYVFTHDSIGLGDSNEWRRIRVEDVDVGAELEKVPCAYERYGIGANPNRASTNSRTGGARRAVCYLLYVGR